MSAKPLTVAQKELGLDRHEKVDSKQRTDLNALAMQGLALDRQGKIDSKPLGFSARKEAQEEQEAWGQQSEKRTREWFEHMALTSEQMAGKAGETRHHCALQGRSVCSH